MAEDEGKFRDTDTQKQETANMYDATVFTNAAGHWFGQNWEK